MHQFLCQSKINSTSRNWNEESLLTGPLAETKKIWNSLNCKTSFPKELEEVTDFCLECWHKLNPPKALIHADLHMGNLKWTPTSLNPIDFDDCGIAPLPYDLAVAASSFYGSKSSIDILHNLLEGYASSGAKPITLKELQLFIAIRSIWLMGWIAERPDIFTKDTMRERIEFRSNSLKSFKENFKI
jgi:Ser/Thr protein kinase RdoA (MazF antagonist)